MNASAPPSDNDYRERYVAFLDLLGFKTLVARAETAAAEKERVHRVLELMRDSLTQNPRLGLRFTHFSDCIVLSIDRTPAGLMEAFESINVLTSNLLQFDVLVRGGLVAGNAHHDGDFVYGTAVNRAFHLEHEMAQDPMILVSEEVFADAKQCGPSHLAWLCSDPAHRQFIHYLRWYAEYRHEPIYAGKVIMDEPAKRIIDFVLGRLASDTDRVLAKAQWLQAYWNETVACNGIFERIEPGVTPRYKSRGPTIMYRRIAGGGPPAPQKATDAK
jgi:hypothetical protein